MQPLETLTKHLQNNENPFQHTSQISRHPSLPAPQIIPIISATLTPTLSLTFKQYDQDEGVLLLEDTSLSYPRSIARKITGSRTKILLPLIQANITEMTTELCA